MLIQRLATAAVGIPVIVLVIWVGGVLLAGVVAVAVVIASIELSTARGMQSAPMSLLAAAVTAVLPLSALAGQEYVLGAAVGALVLLSTGYTMRPDPREEIEGWLWGVSTAVYLGALASYFVLLRREHDGRDWLFFTVITVWVTDTGAYFVGRMIGKHKLAPHISPAKTIEGGFGSLAAGFICVFVLNEALGLNLAVQNEIALGLLMPPVIMVGDLAESALKRSLQIKDSSGLVPGHGGIADRLDSLLFAAPLVYYYLRWVA